jgi:hypothetical protein
MTGLWPEFDLGTTTPSPKTVIEQAGAGLEQKTLGQVRFFTLGLNVVDKVVTVSFSLYSSSLGYHYPFLHASFRIDRSYPVTLVADQVGEFTANDEAELIEFLRKTFNAPSTKETVERLVSLAHG